MRSQGEPWERGNNIKVYHELHQSSNRTWRCPAKKEKGNAQPGIRNSVQAHLPTKQEYSECYCLSDVRCCSGKIPQCTLKRELQRLSGRLLLVSPERREKQDQYGEQFEPAEQHQQCEKQFSLL